MSWLGRDLVFLILQFLDEQEFKETVHKLEQESGVFFNMRYFENMITCGQWEEVEKYLSGFTKVEDNDYSKKIYFQIRKQKYLEALDKRDRAKAVEILVKDLKVFAEFNEDLFKEMTQLLTSKNIRDNEKLSKYGDTKSARGIELAELKKLIKHNPIFRDKLQFPTLKDSSLCSLIDQSLNRQLQRCEDRRSNSDLRTLFVDHSCGQPNDDARAISLMGARIPFHPAPAALLTPLDEWLANPFFVPHPLPSAGPIGLNAANNAAISTPPKTPINNPTMDYYQTTDLERVLKRTRPFGLSEEVNNLPVNILPVGYANQGHGQSSYSSDDLPMNVVTTLTQGSVVNSMDFHPQQQTILLVGTNVGDLMIWEVGGRERIAIRSFEVWDISACSGSLQASLASDFTASINRVMWSPDGKVFGVAYSKHIVHIYTYQAGDDLRNQLEIEAHDGSVNDLAFSYQNKQLSLITCGEDGVIKVWDTFTGVELYTFKGHDAPVYSICPHHKGNIQFIFATSTDGKIKVWLYDNMGSIVNSDAPGHSSTTMAYSADGTRLFSCGTNKEGESHLIEWNDSEGTVKRTYHGLGKKSVGVVQFDSTKNRFLAAGDDFSVKFWDMDGVHLLTSIDADGGLPASACVRFNKDGNLLAVSTDDNGIKILANKEKITIWKLTEINKPTQCRSLRLPNNLTAARARVSRLTYTNAGLAILALASNAVHKLWIWQRNDRNLTGKATASIAPQLWQPWIGILMTNDISDTNPKDAVPCFAITKNDSYVMSASGGKISLFNMVTFETITTIMPPPPAATFLAFHPQDNNIIAIGMDDSSIQIYHVQDDEVKTKLQSHQKRITGLAFSNDLKVLVSSGADSQLCVWSIDGWEKQASKFLQIPNSRTTAPLADTRIQFQADQTHLLAIHETQIAIYEAPKLDCLKQWFPQEASGSITDATYSCDGQSIYVLLEDESVGVLTTSTLRLRCRINPNAYLPPRSRSRVHPLVIAAHPSEPNQFALGLSNGSVRVLEPSESEGKW